MYLIWLKAVGTADGNSAWSALLYMKPTIPISPKHHVFKGIAIDDPDIAWRAYRQPGDRYVAFEAISLQFWSIPISRKPAKWKASAKTLVLPIASVQDC